MQLSELQQGSAKVVVVGFGAKRQAPVGSIAGNLTWLQQPPDTMINSMHINP